MIRREKIRAVVFVLSLQVSTTGAFVAPLKRYSSFQRIERSKAVASDKSLDAIVQELTANLDPCLGEISKVCKVSIGVTESCRLGLFATQSISKGDAMLSMPNNQQYQFRGKSDFLKDFLPSSYDSWTGETGLIALEILNEIARASDEGGVGKPSRPSDMDSFMNSWALALPKPSELDHPILWSEDDQEVLQGSTTNKVYRKLDDLEEDMSWLVKNIFEKDRDRFPAYITLHGTSMPCFNLDGYKWALTLAQSRSFFADGTLCLFPLLDMCNHDDAAEEVRDAYMGTFKTIKGVELVASRDYKAGEEVFCSYGPKSAADYLLEHGFIPAQCWKTAVTELTFELDASDRFYDDKLDILEFETYDQAPMDPVQSFDVVYAPGVDGEPDPAMIQFVRLCQLGSTDAFLLESIFRKEVWSFMEEPVSETNELSVVDSIIKVCQNAVDEFSTCPDAGPDICTKLRESESLSITRAIDFFQREKEALDLKEYYQERRLKDLGLDSVWTPEDDVDDDLGFGQTRKPGDYDW